MVNVEKSTLDKLSIHELRDLARQVGVHLPTTFKRDDLCNEIMDIILGKKEPYVRKTKQGRPPKISRSLSDITEILIPEEESKDYVPSVFNSQQIEFNANNIVYENDEKYSFAGHLICYDTYGIILNYESKPAYITINQISKYNLMSGDYVTGKCRLISDGKRVCEEIESVNKINIDEYKLIMPNKLKPTKVLNVLNNDILIGGTNLIYKDNIDLLDFAKKLPKDYDIVILNINVKEDIFKETYDNVSVYNINYKLNDKEIYELSLAGGNDVKRKSEMTKSNIILIVNNFIELIKINNSYLSNNVTLNDINSNIVKNVKVLMESAFYSNDRSFTMIDAESKRMQQSLKDILEFELYDFYDKTNN